LGRGSYVTGETFQMIGIAQGSHELASQPFATFATDLPTALRLGSMVMVLARVGRGSGGIVCVIVGCKVVG